MRLFDTLVGADYGLHERFRRQRCADPTHDRFDSSHTRPGSSVCTFGVWAHGSSRVFRKHQAGLRKVNKSHDARQAAVRKYGGLAQSLLTAWWAR